LLGPGVDRLAVLLGRRPFELLGELEASVVKAVSLEGVSTRASTVEPSWETCTSTITRRGVSVVPAGSGTRGATSGAGRESKQEPSRL